MLSKFEISLLMRAASGFTSTDPADVERARQWLRDMGLVIATDPDAIQMTRFGNAIAERVEQVVCEELKRIGCQ